MNLDVTVPTDRNLFPIHQGHEFCKTRDVIRLSHLADMTNVMHFDTRPSVETTISDCVDLLALRMLVKARV